METYLVTGGTGNIGAFVTQALAQQGNKVVAYDLTPQRRPLRILLTPAELANVTVVQGDVLDFEQITRLMRTHKVDKIAHFAVAPTAACIANPAHSARVNIEGTNNMFEAALLTGASRVMYCSSGAVFGPRSVGPDNVIRNDAPFDPQDVYGVCKVANELLARNYTKTFGLETIGLRVAGYGPVAGVTNVTWIPNLIEGLLRGTPVTARRGSRPGSWLYAEDTARAVVASLQLRPCPGGVISLGGGFNASNDQFVEIVSRHFPGATIGTEPVPVAGGFTGSSIIPTTETSVARERLEWEPQISLEQGVERIIAYYRAAIALERAEPATARV